MARVWFGQPKLVVQDEAPHIALTVAGATSGIELLRAMLAYELEFPTPTLAPTFVLLPEFAVSPGALDAAKTLIREARPNTVIVFGTGDLSEAHARSLEPGAELWRGPSEQHFTNCAIVGFGGISKIHLQPKLVPSRWETDSLWPGNVVRYFQGDSVQFVVLVCSDFLDRPSDETLAAAIERDLRRLGWVLPLVIWPQHTRNPRANDFVRSMERFRRSRSTLFNVSSRDDRPARLNNYAVSGAVLPRDALSREFDLLTGAFHYTEAVPDANEAISRIVLLRYDADAHRVDTILAGELLDDDRTEKGALFQSVQPYVYDGAALTSSADSPHLEDVLAAAERSASVGSAVLPEYIGAVRAQAVSLGTKRLLSILDVGIVPIPSTPDERHVAGSSTEGATFSAAAGRTAAASTTWHTTPSGSWSLEISFKWRPRWKVWTWPSLSR